MGYYRLYFLNRGKIIRFEEIHAASDGAAREAAIEHAGGLPMELWCGGRRVDTIEAQASFG